MRVRNLITLVMLVLIVTWSCKQEESIVVEQDVIFSVLELSPESSLGGRIASSSEPKSVLVTIKDNTGTVVADRKELPLHKFGDTFLSVPLTLKTNGASAYSLTEFFVIGDDNEVTHATPREGSELAHLVIDPLDIEFTISKNVITTVTPEVLAVDENANPSDYGYGQFGFKVVKTVSAVFSAFIKGVNNFELTTAHLKIEGINDSTASTPLWTYEKELEARANVLTFKQAPLYRITATKQGYPQWVRVVSLNAGSAIEILFLTPNTWDYSRIWGNNYGSHLNDYASSIIQTDDGGFIVRASCENGGPDFPTIPYPSPYTESMANAVLRVDANGNIVWTKRLPGRNFDESRTSHAFIKLQNENSYLIGGGIKYYPGNQNYDPIYDGSTNSSRAFLLKIDDNGEIIWRKHFSGYQKIVSLFQSSDGTVEAIFDDNTSLSLFALTGEGEISGSEKWKREFSSPISHTATYKVRSGYVILDGSKAYKLGQQGSAVEWQVEYNQEHIVGDNGLTMVELSDGYLLFGSKKYLTGCENITGERDLMVTRVSENGQIQWNRILPLAKYAERATAAIEMPSGNILVGGASEYDCVPYEYRSFLLELTPQGDVIGNKLIRASINSGYNTNHGGLITKILSLGQNEYALTGTRQDGYDSDRPRPGYNDIFIMRIKF